MIPFILFAEFVFLVAVGEIMVRRMPLKLRELAAANQQRVDGSLSPRRELAEVRARNRLRLDLYGLLLIVFGIGSGCLLAFHSFVLPLDMGVKIASNFDPDSESFRSNLTDSRLDDTYARDIANRYHMPQRDSREFAKMAFEAWPAVFVLLLIFLTSGGVIMHFGYMRGLRDYAAGLRSRAQEYHFRDLGRIQNAFEHDRPMLLDGEFAESSGLATEPQEERF